MIGLSVGDEKHPLAETTTPDGKYRYRLFELGAVGVEKLTQAKSWEYAYTIRMGVCSCQGFQYRAACKHSEVAAALIRWWAEKVKALPQGAAPYDDLT